MKPSILFFSALALIVAPQLHAGAQAGQGLFDRVTITPGKPDARPCFVVGVDTSQIVLPAANPS